MRIKSLFAIPLVLLVCCLNSRSIAQIPDDIVALAAIHSEDYFYQSNAPFSMQIADQLQSAPATTNILFATQTTVDEGTHKQGLLEAAEPSLFKAHQTARLASLTTVRKIQSGRTTLMAEGWDGIITATLHRRRINRPGEWAREFEAVVRQPSDRRQAS